MDERIYKLVPAEAWSVRGDRVPAAEVDRRDGYVHFSSAAQLRETADKHFRTGGDTWLLEVDAHALPEGTLRWEPSRGGQLFPHVYGDVPRSAVARAWSLTRDADGRLVFPPDL